MLCEMTTVTYAGIVVSSFGAMMYLQCKDAYYADCSWLSDF